MRKLREQNDDVSKASRATSQNTKKMQEMSQIERILKETEQQKAAGPGKPRHAAVSTAVKESESTPAPDTAVQSSHAEKMAQLKRTMSMMEGGQNTAAAPASAPGTALPPLRKTAKPAAQGRVSAQKPVPVSQRSTISPDVPKKLGKLKPLPQDGKVSSVRKAAAADTAPLPKELHKMPTPPRKPGNPSGSGNTKKPAGTSRVSARKPGRISAWKGHIPLSGGQLALIAGGGTAGLLILIYFIVFAAYSGKFLPNTYINQVNVGGMTAEKAEQTLLESARISDLSLVTVRGDTVQFKPEDFDAAYSLPENSMDAAASENHLVWIKKLFSPTEYTIKYNFSFSETKLLDLIRSYDWGNAESKDAYIQKNESGRYEIVPETQGDKFDTKSLAAYIGQQLQIGSFHVDMASSGCYDAFAAKVKTEDLTEKLDVCNHFADCTITFDFSDRQKVIDGQMISDWADVNEAGDIIFNEDAIAQFVAEMAAETDTYGYPLEFNSTLDGLITLPWTDSSNYGWQISQSDTVDQILTLLTAGETVTVEPVYTSWGRGYCRSGNGLGSTYIEVDISAQHVWCYRDGVLQMDSDCVTGTETDPSRATHRGICQILSRERDTVLGTMEVQGYATPVSYWMPFNYNGEGLHDLGRWAYGGDIYMYNGSHGCVNLPYSFAGSVYDFTEYGMPVIVHD